MSATCIRVTQTQNVAIFLDRTPAYVKLDIQAMVYSAMVCNT